MTLINAVDFVPRTAGEGRGGEPGDAGTAVLLSEIIARVGLQGLHERH
jgi:hypothetical protein